MLPEVLGVLGVGKDIMTLMVEANAEVDQWPEQKKRAFRMALNRAYLSDYTKTPQPSVTAALAPLRVPPKDRR